MGHVATMHNNSYAVAVIFNRLQSLRTRMERYRQERDAARGRIEGTEKELVICRSEQETLTRQLQEVSHSSEMCLNELQLKVTLQEESLAKTADYERRMRRYREERNKAMSNNRTLKKQLTTLEDGMSDLFAKIKCQDSPECVQTFKDDSSVDSETEKPPEDNPTASTCKNNHPQLYGIDGEHRDQQLSKQISYSEDMIMCPLCRELIPAAGLGGGDILQLHYLTRCPDYK